MTNIKISKENMNTKSKLNPALIEACAGYKVLQKYYIESSENSHNHTCGEADEE